MNETRSHTIIRYLEAYQRSTGVSWPAIAQDVAEQYIASVRERHRTVRFYVPDGQDPYKAMRANAQIMTRFRDGTNRLPVDLEEAVIDALPATWRTQLQSELLARQGLLFVPIPGDGVSEDLRFAAGLLKETGEAIQALAPMLEDGGIGPEDAPYATQAMTQLDDVIAVATTIKTAIDKRCIKVAGDNVTKLKPQRCIGD